MKANLERKLSVVSVILAFVWGDYGDPRKYSAMVARVPAGIRTKYFRNTSQDYYRYTKQFSCVCGNLLHEQQSTGVGI
jgi:hypothetical protein